MTKRSGVETTPRELVSFWEDFMDWEKRRAGELRNKSYPRTGPFFSYQLKRHFVERVFDACAGLGYDSVELLKDGSFSVVSNEVDPSFKEVARARAVTEGVALTFSEYDWREIPDALAGTFEGVVCLGNSLTYLLNRGDQERAVRNLVKLVDDDCPVIIDQRNYDYMLDNRGVILKNPKENFRYSKQFYYCGEQVDAYPVDIQDGLVVMEYAHQESGITTQLKLYPFRVKELCELMEGCGVKVFTYGDFATWPWSSSSIDFFQHVGLKIGEEGSMGDTQEEFAIRRWWKKYGGRE